MEEENRFYFHSSERKFEFYYIQWIIKNISPVLCKEYWSIKGPVFIAEKPERTMWVVELRSGYGFDNCRFMFFLKRLPLIEEPAKIRVELRAYITSETNSTFLTDIITYCFEALTENNIPLQFKTRYFEKSETCIFDLLRVECELIIYNEDICDRLKPCTEIGLKLLSRNLLSILDSMQYHDVQLDFKDNTILAHRPVLYARCKPLYDYIERECIINTELSKEIRVVNFQSFSYESVKKLLAYLYSGNFNHVLEKPSIHIYCLARKWGIQKIIDIYHQKAIRFETSMQTQEYSYKWIITDFSKKYSSENPISSRRITENSFLTTWRIHLYPKIPENGEHIALFAEALDDISSLGACIELGIVSDSGNSLSSKILHCSHKDTKKFEVVKFAKKDLLECCTASDVLRVTLNLRFSKGETETVFVSQISTFTSYAREDSSFLTLSKDLQSLFSATFEWDDQLKSGQVIYHTHKCILTARCPRFYSIFHGTQTDGSFDASKIKQGAFLNLLTYIYSGVLQNDYERDELIELKEVAESYGMFHLKDSCHEILKNRFFFNS